MLPGADPGEIDRALQLKREGRSALGGVSLALGKWFTARGGPTYRVEVVVRSDGTGATIGRAEAVILVGKDAATPFRMLSWRYGCGARGRWRRGHDHGLASAFPLASVRRFVDWWAGELSDALAARSAAAAALADHVPATRQGLRRLCAHARAHRAGRHTRHRQRSTPGRAAAAVRKRKAAAGGIVLRLPPSEVVETRISVPAAAREVMVPILRNQIERLAPWPVEKALFAYEVADDAGEPGTLAVQLTVTGRNVVEGLVAELDSLGYAPDVVDYGTGRRTPSRASTCCRGRATRQDRSGRVLVSVVAIAMLLSLVAGAVGVGGVWKGHELGETQRQARGLARQEQVRCQAEGYARRQRRQALLAAEKRSQPAMAIMLEALEPRAAR